MSIRRKFLWLVHDIGEAAMKWAEAQLFADSLIKFRE